MKRITIGKHVLEWMRENSKEFGARDGVGIGLQEHAGLHWRMIAGVAYTDWNGPNLCMHVVALGKRWMTREYLWTCFDYPFNQCKVRRVTGLVGEGNVAARKFDEHLGFVLETTLQGAHPSGDLLVYVLWKEKCKWVSQAESYAKAA